MTFVARANFGIEMMGSSSKFKYMDRICSEFYLSLNCLFHSIYNKISRNEIVHIIRDLVVKLTKLCSDHTRNLKNWYFEKIVTSLTNPFIFFVFLETFLIDINDDSVLIR